MLLLSLIFFLHFVIGLILENFKNKFLYYLTSALLLATVFYFTLGVTDNSDNFMFEWFYDHDWDKIDPMFIFLMKVMNYYHYDYFAFYRLHLIIYTLSYFYFISRYTKNIFYVFLIFFVLYYVPYVNQIRYYLAFPFYLLSIHYFIQKRNWILFALFTFLALTSHSAVIILYGFLPLYYFTSSKSFFKLVLFLSGFAFILVLILFQMVIVQEIEHFGEYFNKGMTSSAFGGLFNAIPYFVYITYIYIIDKKYRRNNPDFVQDKTYNLLSKLSYFCIIFIPASFFVQVLGHRYVFPFLIIWIIFYLYTIRDLTPKRKFISFLFAAGVHIFAGFTIYILSYYVLGDTFYIDETLKAMESIKYIDYLDLFKN